MKSYPIYNINKSENDSESCWLFFNLSESTEESPTFKVKITFLNEDEKNLFLNRLENWREHFTKILQRDEFELFLKTKEGNEIRIQNELKEYLLNS